MIIFTNTDMETGIMKKLVVYLIVLGLSFNGFCMNLIAPEIAMAKPMVTPVFTMQMGASGSMAEADTMAKTDTMPGMQSMPMTGLMPRTNTVAHSNMGMTANFNCCLIPINHNGSDKSFEIMKTQEIRQHSNLLVIKLEPVDILKHSEKNHPRLFQRVEAKNSSTKLTGQIVKRE